MKSLSLAGLVASLSLVVPSVALADVSVVRGQFTDRVESSRPVGDATEVPSSGTVVYWMEVRNTGEPTQVTLVWSIDGREVTRQSLDVGRAPRWRTWGRWRRAGHTVSVRVLDAEGNELHTASTDFTATAAP